MDIHKAASQAIKSSYDYLNNNYTKLSRCLYMGRWDDIRFLNEDNKMFILCLIGEQNVLGIIKKFLGISNDQVLAMLKKYFVIIPFDVSKNTPFFKKAIYALQIDGMAEAYQLAMESKSSLVFMDLHHGAWRHRHTYVDGILSYNFEEVIKKSIESSKDDIMDGQEFHLEICKFFHNQYYVIYEPNQHDLLKFKIGFALYGPPTIDNATNMCTQAYADPKQRKTVDTIYKAILKENNAVAKRKNQIVVAIVFTFVQFYRDEKKIVSLTEESYKYVPVFVIKRCEACVDRVPIGISEESIPTVCRIFVDHEARVYSTWLDYLNNNTFQNCQLITPFKGAPYKFDAHKQDKLILQYHNKMVSKAARIVNTSASAVASISTIAVISLPMTIPAAGPILMGATAVSLASGIYQFIRGCGHVNDLVQHKQFDISEERSMRAVYSVAESAIGVMLGASNSFIKRAVTKGSNIGKIPKLFHNKLNSTNKFLFALRGGDALVTAAFKMWKGETIDLTIGDFLLHARSLALVINNTWISEDYSAALFKQHERQLQGSYKLSDFPIMAAFTDIVKSNWPSSTKPPPVMKFIQHVSGLRDFQNNLKTLHACKYIETVATSYTYYIDGVAVDIEKLYDYYGKAVLSTNSISTKEKDIQQLSTVIMSATGILIEKYNPSSKLLNMLNTIYPQFKTHVQFCGIILNWVVNLLGCVEQIYQKWRKAINNTNGILIAYIEKNGLIHVYNKWMDKLKYLDNDDQKRRKQILEDLALLLKGDVSALDPLIYTLLDHVIHSIVAQYINVGVKKQLSVITNSNHGTDTNRKLYLCSQCSGAYVRIVG